MDSDGVDNVSSVGLDVLLLHFGDAEIMDGHEGHPLFMGLFQVFCTLDHLTTLVVELDDLLGFIDVVSFLEQGNCPMWRTLRERILLVDSLLHTLGDSVAIHHLTAVGHHRLVILDLVSYKVIRVYIADHDSFILAEVEIKLSLVVAHQLNGFNGYVFDLCDLSSELDPGHCGEWVFQKQVFDFTGVSLNGFCLVMKLPLY